MKSNLLTTLFATLFCLFQQASAQCDLPTHYTGNTGSNMTVMLTPDFISSLPITHFSSYLVAHSPDGLLIGSEVVAGVPQTSISVWADDAGLDSPQVDGAVFGESISFQLVVDNALYDVEMPIPVSFVSNGISVQTSAATYTLNCTSEGGTTVSGCMDASACNYNSEATEDDNSCIDPVGCETCSGETDGTGVVVDNDADDDGVCNANEVSGCTDASACNYNSEATEDDSSCINPVACETCSGETDGTGVIVDNDADDDGVCDTDEVSGCTDNTASNYNAEATDDDASCEYTTGTCDLPTAYIGITGVNMTLMLTADFISSLPITHFSSYLVAHTPDSLLVGSTVVAGVDQTSLTLWGDDTFTTEIDGAQEGESISFHLVVDNALYAVEMPVAVTYTTNDVLALTSAATYTLNCTSEGGTTVSGCMDASACNYNSEATEDDNSCIDPVGCDTCSGETDGTGVVVDNDADDDGVCNANEVLGCTDASACNYNSEATEDDNSCINPVACETCSGETDGTGVVVDNDADGDGVCDADEVSGCTDNTASNYNAEATDDDDSCVPVIEGCIDSTAFNYDATLGANTDDGSCVAVANGCIDSEAFNYNAEANTDDGSCEEVVFGCTDSTACNINSEANTGDSSCEYAEENYDCEGECVSDVDDDGVCDEDEVSGCTTNTACNYNANASVEDSSCAYAEENYNCEGECVSDVDDDGVCDADEVAGCTDTSATNYNSDATDDNGSCEYPPILGCMVEIACNYNSQAVEDDGLCTYADENYDCEGACLLDADVDGVCDADEVAGCTDASATNYNSEATENDGSCEYPPILGCMVEAACNYNSQAVEDDGSCTYAEENYDCEGACLSDTDVDGVCDTLEVAGCTDVSATNYDAQATENDDSCEYPTISGCTAESACNYSSQASEDDGSCSYAEENYDCDGECVSDVDADGVCDALEVSGCTDNTALNYNSEVFEDDESCVYTATSCILPPHFTGNTGSNMTVMLTSNVISSLPITHYSSYLVAHTQDGLLVGSEVLAGVDQAAIAIWADDVSTPEIDGALDGQVISFQLIVDNTLYDVEMPTAVSFTSNGLSAQTSSAITTLNCIFIPVLGCTDPIASNYNVFANVDDETCEYSICVWFDVNNFAVEYSTVLDEVVLSYDVTNLSNQVVFAPEFNIELDSSIFVLGDSVYDSTQMNPNDVVTIHAVITNDLASLSSLVLLSGQVYLTGTTGDAEGEVVDCLFDLNEVFVNTTHVGCTSANAYNYSEEATIDNSSCIANLSTSVVSYDPLCADEYGSALIYVTGGIYPYFSPTTYTTYSTTGVLSSDIPIEFNVEGIAHLSGLDGGEYVIEVHDNSIVVTLDTFNIVMPLGIEVEAEVQSDGLLTSTIVLGEPVLYQWLLEGISIEGATYEIYYPQDLGTYQVYVENAQGCRDYSEPVELSFISIVEFSGNSFTVYPNPARSSITLSLDQLNGETMVSFTDVLGQELHKVILDSKASTVDYTFDISELSNGLYFINVSHNSNQIVKRFVKN